MTGQSVCYNLSMLKLILYLTVLLVSLTSCSDEKENNTAKRSTEETVEIKVLKVKEEEIEILYEANTTLEADKDVVILPKVGGTVERIFVKEGQKVSKGDILIKIDDGEIKASLNKAESDLKAIEANYENTKKMYDRRKDLAKENLVSKEELSKLESSLKAYKAQIESIKANIELLRLRLSYTEVKAPFNGNIAEIFIDEGENVSPQHKLLRIVNTDKLYGVFKIPQRYINKISKDKYVTIKIEGVGETKGKIVYISPVADKDRMIKVKAEIINNKEILKPGMFGIAQIHIGKEKVFRVPEHAVQFSGNTNFVWLYENGSVRRSVVNIVSKRGNDLLIKGNIEEGDMVVTDNSSKLKEGVKVKIK